MASERHNRNSGRIRHLRAALLSGGLGAIVAPAAWGQAAPTAVPLAPIIIGVTDGAAGNAGPHVVRDATGALKSSAPLDETPQAVTVIPRRALQDQAATSVGQALTYAVNANGQRYGNDLRSDYFTVRGFPADQFLNGLRVPQIANQTGGYAGVRVDPYTLDRIEVLRGPASALFGQSNVGGVVNMVSKTPQDTPSAEVYVRAGSFDLREVGFDVTGPLSPTLGYRMIGVVRDGRNSFDFGKNDRLSFAPSLTWRPTDATQVTFEASYLSEDLGHPNVIVPAAGSIGPNVNGDRIPVDFSDGDGRLAIYDKDVATLGYRLEHRLSDGLTLHNSLRFTHLDTDYRGMFTRSLSADERTITRMLYLAQPEMDALVADLHVEADAMTGPATHRIIAGVDYQRQSLVNHTGSVAAGPEQSLFDPTYDQAIGTLAASARLDQTSYQLGTYVQDEIRIGRLTGVAGLRYDHYKTASGSTTLATGVTTPYYMEGEELTGRIGASYRLDNGLAPYVLYSTSFLPTLTLSDTPLKPTTGTLREVGVKYAPDTLPLFLGLSYFQATQSNVVNRISGVYYQTDEVRVEGAELEVQASLTDRFHLNAALSRQTPEVTRSETAGQVGKMPYTVPKRQASLFASYDLDLPPVAGQITVGGGVRHIGKTSGDTLNTFFVPSVTLADAFVSYETDRYRFQINGYNLADKRYVAGCNSSIQCYFGAERTIAATLSVKW